MSNKVEEKIGYLTGVLEGVQKDVVEGREEVRLLCRGIRETFNDHAESDKRNFGELGKQLQEVRDVQSKVKWWVLGASATFSLVASVSVYSYKVLS